MAISLFEQTHAASITTSFQLNADPRPEVTFSMTNRCPDLIHLVIYDYKNWLESEEEEAALLSLDATVDNMASASKRFKAVESGLYLVRAYFDYNVELEGIVYIPSTDPIFNLEIAEFEGDRSLNTWAPIEFISSQKAHHMLNASQA